MRTAIELGPKGKKVVAYAINWPGLERGAKTDELAIEKLATYRVRYLTVAKRAGLSGQLIAEPDIDVVIEYEGTGSTDFWGISFAHSAVDHEPLSPDELERHLALLQACWDEFDDIVFHVSPELRKGPRGGGRDRDHIVRHLLAAELDWVKKLGIRLSLEDVIEPENRRAFHSSIIDAIHDHHAEGKPAQSKGGPAWTCRFMIRHLAYHVMDHAWEMEDRDLTGKRFPV